MHCLYPPLKFYINLCLMLLPNVKQMHYLYIPLFNAIASQQRGQSCLDNFMVHCLQFIKIGQHIFLNLKRFKCNPFRKGGGNLT